MFDLIAQILAGFYALPVVGGSYGLAIILLTAAVMVVLMPLTMKATRSTIKMQMVQPELKRLQKQYRDDRVKMNEELMALYKQHNINPVGGCLPMLAQLPVFLVLFNVLRGLTRRASEAPWFGVTNVARAEAGGLAPLDAEAFNPRYLHHDTQLYQSLSEDDEMRFGVFDLALHPLDVLRDDFVTAIPYVLLILFVVATAYYQQRQISARRGAQIAMPAQQQALLRILPLFTGIWSFVFPAGLVLYWATSNVFRIGQQAYITHRLYAHEDSPGRKAIEVSGREADHDGGASSAKKAGAGTPKVSKQATDGRDRRSGGSERRRERTGGSKDKSVAAPRSERWSKERAVSRSSAPKPRTTTSGRVTPKGSTGTSSKKKRKR